mmetsp:Transcript_7875/g.13924  ORF Transcript_7875/g.13924 Transcript_7875/m.13924 type:complete len:227 (-) Transcript_7875:34-714(-)|eukprot:CAMPEP_0184528076 /NCGR_PEP_ID=MMETSP0198_2-20121128/11592_1 /TAXON_ID=1112570 /ORGANISM="Thraustochytrium sp., Strain LLF1b" /LENGTH=226 /DNA_ID=CAMNT_0026919885 /DNA_START=201 /DNA_END=881 /DNA_ORIENTATION=-
MSETYAEQASHAVEGLGDKVKGMAPEKLTFCMRITNIINASLLGLSGFLTFTILGECANESSCSVVTMTVLAFYTIVFAFLLLLFEAKASTTRRSIVKNFGFMYSNRGKATFLLFLSTLCFSVIDKGFTGPWWMPLFVGLYTLVNGCFVCIAVYLNPSFDAYSKAHAMEEMGGTGASAGVHRPPSQQSNYAFGDAGASNGDSFQYTTPQPGFNGAQQDTENPFSNV